MKCTLLAEYQEIRLLILSFFTPLLLSLHHSIILILSFSSIFLYPFLNLQKRLRRDSMMPLISDGVTMQSRLKNPPSAFKKMIKVSWTFNLHILYPSYYSYSYNLTALLCYTLSSCFDFLMCCSALFYSVWFFLFCYITCQCIFRIFFFQFWIALFYRLRFN